MLITPSIKPIALEPAQKMTTTADLHKLRFGSRQGNNKDGHKSADSAFCLHSGKMSHLITISEHELILFQQFSVLVTIVNHLCTCKYVKKKKSLNYNMHVFINTDLY